MILSVCLLLIGFADASFMIQKMTEDSSRKSFKSSTTKNFLSSTRNPVNSLVRISAYQPASKSRIIYSTSQDLSKKSAKRKSRSKSKDKKKELKADWSSVNVISSVGGNSMNNRKSFTKKANWNSVNVISSLGSNNVKSHKSRVSSIQSPTTFLNLKPKQQPAKINMLKSANNVTIDDFVYVDLPLNQWTQFYFSEVGQLPYSRWTFDIPATDKCSLQVVDSFCTGDRFEATRRLDNGQEIPLLSTPPVPYNPAIAEQIRLGSTVNCTPFTTDAETAWASSAWSKGQVALQPGNYKLILKSLLAPYGSGGAFAKLDCQSTTPPTPAPSQGLCSYGSSSIKYVRQPSTFPQQASACKAYGLQPLAATTSNIKEAHDVLMNCAGVETRAWIASYNGDTYGGVVGLSLHATQMTENGAITATPDTAAIQGALCQ